MEDLKSESRMIIYPCINVVLMGDDVRRLLASFEEDAGDNGIQMKADLEEEGADGADEGLTDEGLTEEEMTSEEGEPWNRR